jgi:hypothetical protein
MNRMPQRTNRRESAFIRQLRLYVEPIRLLRQKLTERLSVSDLAQGNANAACSRRVRV